MRRSFALKLMAVVSALACFSSVAHAVTWNSDWGPVRVKADGKNFVAQYKNRVSGIIVMRNQGGGNYSGYWARQCTNKKRLQIPAPVYSTEGSCLEKRETASGSLTNCWGYISGHANASDTKFMGTFYTCNNKRMGNWNGWK